MRVSSSRASRPNWAESNPPPDRASRRWAAASDAYDNADADADADADATDGWPPGSCCARPSDAPGAPFRVVRAVLIAMAVGLLSPAGKKEEEEPRPAAPTPSSRRDLRRVHVVVVVVVVLPGVLVVLVGPGVVAAVAVVAAVVIVVG